MERFYLSIIYLWKDFIEALFTYGKIYLSIIYLWKNLFTTFCLSWYVVYIYNLAPAITIVSFCKDAVTEF